MLQGRARVQLFKQLFRTSAAPTFGGTAQDRGKVGYLLTQCPRVMVVRSRSFRRVNRRRTTPALTARITSALRKVPWSSSWDAFGDAKLICSAPRAAIRDQPGVIGERAI